MNNSRMTLRQLCEAYGRYNSDSIYLTSQTYPLKSGKPVVELTNILKSYSGLMNMEVCGLFWDNDELFAVLDIPAEWLEHTEG